MTTPEMTPSETATSEVAAQEAARKRMQGRFPYCPPREHFPVVTGFVTPGSDFPPPHPLDASINMEVYDPTETISHGKFERIRVVEVDDDWLLEVNWCVCGAFATSFAGGWVLRLF